MAKMLKSETEYTSDTGTDSTVIPSPDEPALKHHNLSWMFSFYTLFFLLGTINNFGYVIVLTGSAQLSSKFKNDNLTSIYLLSLIVFSSVGRSINSKLLIKFSYHCRIIFFSVYSSTALIIMFFILKSSKDGNLDSTVGFWLSLIPSIMIGTACSMGESTLLGYLRNFPKNLVSGWAGGTGIAGILGSGTTLLFEKLEVEIYYVYLFMPILYVLFASSFFTIDKLYRRYLKKIADEQEDDKLENFNKVETLVKQTDMNDYSNNKPLNWENFKISMIQAKWYVFNIAAVYFLEYCIFNGLCDRFAKKKVIDNQDTSLYEILGLCYQIGVFISRLSVSCLKIPSIEIMTIIQFINYILWFIQATVPYLFNEYVLYIHLIFVGLMGGASYSNAFYFLLKDPLIEPDMKELSVNITTIFNDAGIFCASLHNLIIALTFLKLTPTTFNRKFNLFHLQSSQVCYLNNKLPKGYKLELESSITKRDKNLISLEGLTHIPLIRTSSAKNINYNENRSSDSNSDEDYEQRKKAARKEDKPKIRSRDSSSLMQVKIEKKVEVDEVVETSKEIIKINEHCYKLYRKLLNHPNINLLLNCNKITALAKDNVTFKIVESKLKNNKYTDSFQFYRDVRSIWMNYFNIYLNDNILYQKINTLNLFFENAINESNTENISHNTTNNDRDKEKEKRKEKESGSKSSKFNSNNSNNNGTSHNYNKNKISQKLTSSHNSYNSHNNHQQHHNNNKHNSQHTPHPQNTSHTQHHPHTPHSQNTPQTQHTPSTKDRKIIQDEDEDIENSKSPYQNNNSNHTQTIISKKSSEISSNNSKKQTILPTPKKIPLIAPVKRTILNKDSKEISKDNDTKEVSKEVRKESSMKVNTVTNTAIQMPTEEQKEALKILIITNLNKLSNKQKEGINEVVSDCKGVERDSNLLEFDLDLLSLKKVNDLTKYISNCLQNNLREKQQPKINPNKIEEIRSIKNNTVSKDRERERDVIKYDKSKLNVSANSNSNGTNISSKTVVIPPNSNKSVTQVNKSSSLNTNNTNTNISSSNNNNNVNFLNKKTNRKDDIDLDNLLKNCDNNIITNKSSSQSHSIDQGKQQINNYINVNSYNNISINVNSKETINQILNESLDINTNKNDNIKILKEKEKEKDLDKDKDKFKEKERTKQPLINKLKEKSNSNDEREANKEVKKNNEKDIKSTDNIKFYNNKFDTIINHTGNSDIPSYTQPNVQTNNKNTQNIKQFKEDIPNKVTEEVRIPIKVSPEKRISPEKQKSEKDLNMSQSSLKKEPKRHLKKICESDDSIWSSDDDSE